MTVAAQVHDVTSDVDKFYRQADVLLFTSLNEVCTPLPVRASTRRRVRASWRQSRRAVQTSVYVCDLRPCTLATLSLILEPRAGLP